MLSKNEQICGNDHNSLRSEFYPSITNIDLTASQFPAVQQGHQDREGGHAKEDSPR